MFLTYRLKTNRTKQEQIIKTLKELTMLVMKYLLISMIYGFILAGLKDAFPPIKKRLNLMFKDAAWPRINNLWHVLDKKTRDGDSCQQRRASCWTNAP